MVHMMLQLLAQLSWKEQSPFGIQFAMMFAEQVKHVW
jgi:hypothetical protein